MKSEKYPWKNLDTGIQNSLQKGNVKTEIANKSFVERKMILGLELAESDEVIAPRIAPEK